jgi:ribosomal protein S18 acetylase RimI-like enzyme
MIAPRRGRRPGRISGVHEGDPRDQGPRQDEQWQDDRALELTGPRPDELATLAALAARCQRDPRRHCVYTGDDATTITADVTDVESWEQQLVVARWSDEAAAVQGIAGWLLAEVDHEIDRVWWWGPFVDDGHDWPSVADALYRHARARLGSDRDGPAGEEMAADQRSELFAELAARHGFTAEEGSACLVLHPPTATTAATGEITSPSDVTIDALRPEHHDAVAALHDELFPGVHTTGRGLVTADSDRLVRLVAVLDGRVVGYVATELQHDGSLYIDFVGVAADVTRRGIGRSLVAEACREGFGRGATFAHLTVRTSNAAALAVYRSLGFDEDRVLAPYRLGISLG